MSTTSTPGFPPFTSGIPGTLLTRWVVQSRACTMSTMEIMVPRHSSSVSSFLIHFCLLQRRNICFIHSLFHYLLCSLSSSSDHSVLDRQCVYDGLLRLRLIFSRKASSLVLWTLILNAAVGKETANANFPMDNTHTSPWLADTFSKAFVLGVKCGTSPFQNFVVNATSRLEGDLLGTCEQVNHTLPIRMRDTFPPIRS